MNRTTESESTNTNAQEDSDCQSSLFSCVGDNGDSIDLELGNAFSTLTCQEQEGEFEDEKADMVSKLMKNHATIVSSSLVERANLIQSIKWLSHHVSGGVVKSLFESILSARQPTECKQKQDQSESTSTHCREESCSLTIDGTPSIISTQQPSADHLPPAEHHDGALLFVDISGFTKLSVSLDVESLSNVINTYFQMIIDHITNYGGDILKFAGDAIFAEWKESGHNPDHDLAFCVSQAADCAAAIVANCSDYVVLSKPIASSSEGVSRRTSLVSMQESSAIIRRTLQRSASVDVSGGDESKHNDDHMKQSIRQPLSEGVSRSSSLVSMQEFSARIRRTLQRSAPVDMSGGCDSKQYGDNIEQSMRRSLSEGCLRRTSLVSMQESPAIIRRTLQRSSSVDMSGEDDSKHCGDSMEQSIRQQYKGSPRRRHSESSNYKDNGEQRQRRRRKGALVCRRHSVEKMQGLRSSLRTEVATLNVKCGIGAGHMVVIHVGNDVSRREYLILGDPVSQVARAESLAQRGEVFASPEAILHLAKSYNITGEEKRKDDQPFLIANHKEYHIDKSTERRAFSRRESFSPPDGADALLLCDNLDLSELQALKKTMSLYVHPVVVHDDDEWSVPTRHRPDKERHLAEAELRNVYTCFITPLVDCDLSGDKAKDQKLFCLLNEIMNTTTRELDKVQGHLRQYILDDKGLVLICTFGLRGSTFLNMIAQNAMPFSLSIHRALEEELGVPNRIGATFGRAYCGVVGGLDRHEFAILGPSVNFSARLMASKDNPGILVDKNVRLLTSQVFFKPLPAVRAKGFDEPVPIFEPIQTPAYDNWERRRNKNFIGRSKEIMHIMRIAKDVVFGGTVSRLLFVSAMSGTGKSALMAKSTEYVRAMMKKMYKKVITLRNTSQDGDSRVPFRLFRSIFKDMLPHACQNDEDSQTLASLRTQRSGSDFPIDEQWDNLSLQSQSSKGSGAMGTDATRFRFICQELNATTEFMEVVGQRLLGLLERNPNDVTASGKGPDLQKIIDFIVDAFIRCTRHANLVLLMLDDVQWMDEMSWKVVQAIFERVDNVLILCGSRPLSSNPLHVDSQFWSDLQGHFRKDGLYSELSLVPFTEHEVQQLIASSLGYQVIEIASSFVHDIFTTSGGMPHYLTYILDVIKRQKRIVRLENGMVGVNDFTGGGNKEFGSVGELLLYRLDALDSSVRTVLLLSAVLGTEFELLDIVLAYEEMYGVVKSKQLETAMQIREAFDVAVGEGIIEKSSIIGDDDDDDYEEMENDEEDNPCQSLGSIVITVLDRKKAHPFYAKNRRLRFTHDSWTASILNVMLDERKREIHKHVAASLEKDLADEAHNQEDFEKQIRAFKHWKLGGNFSKAALLALNIGGQLMMLGLNSQAVLLFDDALDTLKEMASDDELDMNMAYGGIGVSVLEAIDAPELEYLLKLKISKGKAMTTLGRALEGAETYQCALDILNNTPCAAGDAFDRSVSFPIFSGLFVVLKMGAIEQDSECSYEKELCKKFVEQARLNGDPVHYGRAMAMQAETLGHLSHFEEALEVVDQVKSIYDIETQHALICKAYGSDRLGQIISISVNFHAMLGQTNSALETCLFVVENIIPKSDPKNVHNSYCLCFPVIVVLKENGFAMKALELFRTRVVEPFDEHFGPGGSTYAKPIFKPILTMLDLQAREGQDQETIDELALWALDKDKFEGQLKRIEPSTAPYAVSSTTFLGEICFELAKRQPVIEKRRALLQKARGLAEQSVSSTTNIPYANMYARKKLGELLTYLSEVDEH